MCGICGKVNFNGAKVDEALIAQMCKTLIHRGPDAQGIYTAGYVGLGQRRLSIIDLSQQAVAPLTNEDHSIWITFNGEIYNFQELREDLIRQGHVFTTRTDTEVIVHLYEEYGTECLAKLRGMFAFAIWDATRKRLFAARDRLGKKPFFYTRTARAFIFGSEIKAITADPDVSVSPNFRAINDYLTLQYVPSPQTAFVDIFKLPPAHFLVCDVNGELKIERYWSPPEVEKTKASQHEIKEELLRLLRESVKLRLMADVPIGAFLSGGIDSATVVALMAQESSQPVKTFSIGFEEEAYDELPFARLVAKRYQTEHHEIIVRPSAIDVLPLLVRHYNEPFADYSALPTYYVSKATREHVTVALSGDGGDENFSGYDGYGQILHWAKTDFIPYPIRHAASSSLQALAEAFPANNRMARISRGFYMFGARLPQRYRLQSTVLKPQEKKAGYTPYFNSLLDGNVSEEEQTNITRWDESMSPLDWMMRHDQNSYLPDCLMVKTDIAAMANSLEVRCPFLDHKFVEFSATIPASMKRDATGGKLILKEAVKELVPPEIIHKPKTGFSVPLARWLRGELSGLLRGTLLDERVERRGLFKRPFLRQMVDQQLSGQRDWSHRLWAVMLLELWFREFID